MCCSTFISTGINISYCRVDTEMVHDIKLIWDLVLVYHCVWVYYSIHRSMCMCALPQCLLLWTSLVYRAELAALPCMGTGQYGVVVETMLIVPVDPYSQTCHSFQCCVGVQFHKFAVLASCTRFTVHLVQNNFIQNKTFNTINCKINARGHHTSCHA